MPQAVIASSTTDRSAVDAERQFEPYRRELTGYCYRMLGSASESEDAVQETMIRAWRAFDRFEGRSSVRSWLYRIATNVCLDMLGGAQRRARPMDLTERGTVDSPLQQRAEVTWIGPVPDASVLTNDPEQAAVNRESIKLAFIAMLQHLPPRQRAVLIMREVLCWQRRRGRRPARDHGGLGQQRAAARPGHARGRAHRPHRSHAAGRRPRAGAARQLPRRLRALRHGLVARPAARRRHDVDAAVRPVAAGPRRDRAVAARTRAPSAATRGSCRWRRTARSPMGSTGDSRTGPTRRGR